MTDKFNESFSVPKSIPIVSSFQIKKPRKTPNTAFYGVTLLPAAGVEPAQNTDVGRCWKMLCQNAFQNWLNIIIYKCTLIN